MSANSLDQMLLDGKISIVDYSCELIGGQVARAKEKKASYLWTLEAQYTMWTNIRDAHKNGKKVVWFGGIIPTELLAAFDCVPVYLDVAPIRLSPSPELAGKFIDEAHKYCPSTMCGLDAIELGMTVLDQFGDKPDAFIYSAVPCDSSRTAYPAMQKLLGVPTFIVDYPYRRDERGIQYLSDQTEKLIEFMEELTGEKLDWEKFKHYMGNANRCFDLQIKNANLRKHKPCPLPGRFLVMNSAINAMSYTEEMGNLLETEYKLGCALVEKGVSACPGGEKHRAAFLQDMLWSSAGTLDWLETQYGTSVVMDTFGFQHGDFYEHMDDRKDCLRTMAKKQQNDPMIHGAAGPTENYKYLVNELFEEYEPDVSIFMGHIGCKHTWASAKIITDMVQEKFGLPTLFIDVDGVDGRYKTNEDIKSQISEYMDTVVNG
ncbi:MAG: 2-hydroxyacyl-CoA dehydratase family protein [Oscillospiraceae bacterium]